MTERLAHEQPQPRADYESVAQLKHEVFARAVARMTNDREEREYGYLSRQHIRESAFGDEPRAVMTYVTQISPEMPGREHRVEVSIDEPMTPQTMGEAGFAAYVSQLIENDIADEHEGDDEEEIADCDLINVLRNAMTGEQQVELELRHSTEYVFRPMGQFKIVSTTLMCDGEAIDTTTSGGHPNYFESYIDDVLDYDGAMNEADEEALDEERELLKRANDTFGMMTDEDLQVVRGIMGELGLYRPRTARQLAKRARNLAIRDQSRA